MMMHRRTVLSLLATGGVLAPLWQGSARTGPATRRIRPRRLKEGATVGLINPAGATFDPADITLVQETLLALGLKSVAGKHVLDRYGYLAGRDTDRASDVNTMFADPSIDAILAIRGGWGCSRILPLLDYETIARHPKILSGYSDITSLLIAVYAKTGLVTFHGPVGTSTWNRFSVDFFRSVLMSGATPTLENPRVVGDNLVATRDRVDTITPGTVHGILVGGNLSVLTAMLGSPYLPEWNGVILFLEEDGEQIYRVDRMMTQLKLAGVLDRIAGFVMGKCTGCDPGPGYGSLTLREVLDDHIRPLGIPAFAGAMIGHIENKFTVPVGSLAQIDARKGTLTLLEPAVE